jgi:hypothetical protein
VDDDEDLLSAFGAPPLPSEAAIPEPPPETPRSTPAQPRPETAPAPKAEEPESPAVSASNGAPDIGLVRRKWRLVGEELVRANKRMVQSVLTDSEPDRFETDTLVVRFPFKTNAEVFNSRGKEFSAPLIEAIQRVTGIMCRVRTEVDAGKPAAGGAKAAATAAAASRPVAAAAARPQDPARSDPARPPSPPPSATAPNTDLTHDIVEIFEGRILDPREGAEG